MKMIIPTKCTKNLSFGTSDYDERNYGNHTLKNPNHAEDVTIPQQKVGPRNDVISNFTVNKLPPALLDAQFPDVSHASKIRISFNDFDQHHNNCNCYPFHCIKSPNARLSNFFMWFLIWSP